MCKFIGKSNERILCKLSKSEILRLYSIVHVAMETTKTSILPVNQNLSSVYFSLAKFQLVSCNLSLAMIWQMTYTHKLQSEIEGDDQFWTNNTSPVAFLFLNKVMFLLRNMLIHDPVYDEPLLSGQPPLNGHLLVSQGWLLIGSSTVISHKSHSKGVDCH